MLTHLLYVRKFENATWILTDKEKVATEYTSREMEAQVVSAFVSYHNKRFSQEPSEPAIEERNVSVKYLRLGGCVILRNKKSMRQFVTYNQIFPNYEIECYGYRYQCPHCAYLLDEIKPKDEEHPEYPFCSNCLIAVSLS